MTMTQSSELRASFIRRYNEVLGRIRRATSSTRPFAVDLPDMPAPDVIAALRAQGFKVFRYAHTNNPAATVDWERPHEMRGANPTPTSLSAQEAYQLGHRSLLLRYEEVMRQVHAAAAEPAGPSFSVTLMELPADDVTDALRCQGYRVIRTYGQAGAIGARLEWRLPGDTIADAPLEGALSAQEAHALTSRRRLQLEPMHRAPSTLAS
jgi:hypothetical protein